MANATEVDAKLAELEKKLQATKGEIVALLKERSGEEVKDYELTDRKGAKVSLSSLFGDKSDLIVIHNMGKGCAYCTTWADGFNGEYQHLQDRAGFVLVSNDDSQTMSEFTEGRSWKFTCLSGADSDFTSDMGYRKPDGSVQPGISTFKKDSSGKIIRVAHTWFGPGDEFCAVWPILDLLDKGADNWSPKYSY